MSAAVADPPVGTRAVPDVAGLSILDAALAYAAAGFWLVPTHPSDIKNPGSVLGRHWQRHSSRDPEQLRTWFTEDNGRGIALHTGPSGVVAFDLDQPSAIPPLLIRAIATSSPPHQSTRIDTRGRGHYLFYCDPADPPGSSAKAIGPSWGEVRSGNTVIILEPTPHPSSVGRYRWVTTGTIPPLPAELAAALSAPATRADSEAAQALEAELADAGPPDERMMELLRPCLAQIAEGVCRHDSMRTAQLALVDAAAGGAKGLTQALQWLREAFENQIGHDPSRAGEFDRTLQGAFAIKAAELQAGLFDLDPEAEGPVEFGQPTEQQEEPDQRPLVMVDGNRLAVIQNLQAQLLARWNGSALFNYGGAVATLVGHQVRQLTPDDWPLWLARTARTMQRKGNDRADTWPDKLTMAALRASHNDYAELQRVARAPFLRTDGTVCAHPGYDPASQTVLVLDPAVAWMPIPDHPSPDQIRAATWTLVTDWLGDMPFENQSDRANAIGTALTPFIRGTVPLSPLAVIDGTQMGVGKNLLADCISLTAAGTVSLPMAYTRDDDETRKAVLAAFRAGTDLFVFDEAHFISGPSLARALTSITYTDRLLGTSQMLECPNRVTWMALGNNVRVEGDMSRRVYRVRLAPTDQSPELRDNGQFAHPNLRAWTLQNRPRLVQACLTLIRAWHVAGCPAPDRPVSMGSFEPWEHAIGGILQLAGIEGFLEGTGEWRSQADHTSQYWTAHLQWLAATFPDGQPFTTAQVRHKLVSRSDPAFSGEPEVTPPHMFNPEDKDYSFRLGVAYARTIGRSFDGYRLARPPTDATDGIARTGKVARWMVVPA